MNSTKKRFIEKFIENKQIPNVVFSLNMPDGVEVTIELTTTVERIYDHGQGLEVKKILKKGQFRNATIEKCLKLFEGAAQRFLLDDIGGEHSALVQDILAKAHRRKDTLFVEFKEGEFKQMYEIIFIDKDECEQPYLLKHMGTKEIVISFDKRGFIEFLLKEYEQIVQVI
ncbi:hypothetical protein [Viridibacillus arvi]|uniref:hypothetical protein n=1 Tax=Viridibacillus arvi TaxID=263475 RepID=UPI0034CED19C